jgi:hypothetical protein
MSSLRPSNPSGYAADLGGDWYNRDGSTFKAYGIEGRPQTVLVDRDGVVRGILYPSQLTVAVLENFIRADH